MNSDSMLSLFRRCLSLVDRSTHWQAVGVVVLMIIGAFLEVLGIGLVFPLVKILAEPSLLTDNEWARRILGPVTTENRHQALVLLAGGFFGVIVFKNAFLLLIYAVQARFLNKSEAVLAGRLFDHYLHGDYRLHLMRNSAGLINNVVSTASAVYSHALRGFMTIGIEVFLISVLTVVLLVADPVMTVGALVLVSIGVAVFYLVIKRWLAAWGQQVTVIKGRIMQNLQQGLHSIKEVKVFGREAFVFDGFDSARRDLASVLTRIHVANAAPRLWIETVTVGGAIIGVIYIVLKGGSSGLFSVLALFAAAAFRLIPSMNRILTAMNSIRGGTYPVNAIYDDLHAFQRSAATLDGGKLPFHRALSLDDVCFTYPDTSTAAVANINLTITKGESVGLVGPSGAGKSTLVDIILGLLPPQSGRILVDGVDIRENIRAWRRRIGYVPQTNYLLDDTLRRNIAFGIEDDAIEEKRIRDAVFRAQLGGLVAQLPNGLDTPLGERGARISGGQRQRVGIARALYLDPDIMVLDEATSSLDSETEHAINQAIERLRGVKTIIVIAHRLSTVRQCDRLIFLVGGRIVDIGTFEELTARNDTFRNLVELATL